MKKLVAALALTAAVLTGCSSASDRSKDPASWSTKTIQDGNRHAWCVLWVPSGTEPAGSQMECDFR